MSESIRCKNCGSELKSFYKHCPQCGQKIQEELTLGVLFSNTISNYFSVDARFFKSFIPLIFRPGFLARKFIEGKRMTYLHPAQFYLFISVVFFFMFSFKVREYNAAADKALKQGFKLEKNLELKKEKDSVNTIQLDSIEGAKFAKQLLKNPNVIQGMTEDEIKILDSTLSTELTKKRDSNFNLGYDAHKLDSLIEAGASEKELIRAIGIKDDDSYFKRTFGRQVVKFHQREGGGIVQAIFDTIPIALFFLLPIFSLILKLIYWRKGRFAHHLVFSFYYFSFLFLVMALLFGVNQFLWKVPGWLISSVVVYIFVYLWLSLRRFYNQGYFLSFLKAGTVIFVNMIFLIPAIILIITASFMFY